MEVRELLSSYEFPGDDTPIIRRDRRLQGAGRTARMMRRTSASTSWWMRWMRSIPEPERALDQVRS